MHTAVGSETETVAALRTRSVYLRLTSRPTVFRYHADYFGARLDQHSVHRVHGDWRIWELDAAAARSTWRCALF
jgi:hypothetical protein